MRRVLPSGEVIHFLMVGGFNTVFSLALYNAFVVFPVAALRPPIEIVAVADLPIANYTALPIAITVAFLCLQVVRLPHEGQLPQGVVALFCRLRRGFPTIRSHHPARRYHSLSLISTHSP